MSAAEKLPAPPPPPPRLSDPGFRYVPADQTDIRKTFARIEAEIAKRKANEGK